MFPLLRPRPTLVLAVLLHLGILALIRPANGQGHPPNIVVVFADDLGYGDVRAYNPSARTRTPVLDQLSAAGMRFTDAHVSASVCTPSRYGLLTGRYAWRTSLKKGVLRAWAPLLLEDSRDTLASLLQRHGYSTAVIGKWHLGLGQQGKMTTKFSNTPEGLRPGPNERGFGYSFIIPASANMSPLGYYRNLHPVNGVSDAPSPPFANWPTTPGNGGYPSPLGYDPGPIAPGIDTRFDEDPSTLPRFNQVLPRLTTEAVSFIRNHSEASPLFLYFALPSPHTPWVPENAPRDASPEDLYLAFVNETDTAVGRVIAALQDTQRWENTLFIFTSDNGPELRPFDVEGSGHDPAGGWRGEKSDLFEAGHRVPFLAAWSGHIPAGTVSPELVSTLDLYATFAALLQDERPPHLRGGEDSRNILPLLRGEVVAVPPRRELVMHSSLGRFGLRQGDWVYLDWPGSGGYLMPDENPEGTPGQLYDLSRDPAQSDNVYADHRDRVVAMQDQLRAIQRKAPAD